MCFNTDDDQDVKNIPQDEYNKQNFSKTNVDSIKDSNENSISVPQGECLTSCDSFPAFKEDNCGKFSELKTSNCVLNNYNKLLSMRGEINEMIFAEPNLSDNKKIIKLLNKGHTLPEVINMSMQHSTRPKAMGHCRDGLKNKSNNYTNNYGSNEGSVKSDRNMLCFSRGNASCYDDMGIYSTGHSNGSQPRSRKEQKRTEDICNFEDNDQDRLVCQSSNYINPAMEKGNCERKWKMVYADRIYKSQTLHPCPTCGRKFNDEAASRHFPICLKGKEKRALALIQKQKKVYSNKITSNPQLTTLSQKGNIDKKEESLKKVNKIDLVYQKIVKKQTPVKDENMNLSPISSNVPIIAEPKMILLDSSMSDFSCRDQAKQASNAKKTSNKVAIHQSDSIKKSVNIWKKSVKEFVKSKKKSSLRKRQEEDEDDASSNKNVITEVESPQTWNGNRAIGKFPNAHASHNNEFRSSSFKNNENYLETVPKTKPSKNLNANAGPPTNSMGIMNDLDIIPENIPIKKERNNSNLKIYDLDRKTSICGVCGSNVRENNLENHLELCLRIKRLESNFIKEMSSAHFTQSIFKLSDTAISTENSQYRLFKNAGDAPHAKVLQAIVSLKCPCCFTLLDLCKTN